nr:NADH dehydrogenase [ubiquinone] 1 alpha subcomplex assembly factor 2 isoform X2 [Oryctolagus cuniculus]
MTVKKKKLVVRSYTVLFTGFGYIISNSSTWHKQGLSGVQFRSFIGRERPKGLKIISNPIPSRQLPLSCLSMVSSNFQRKSIFNQSTPRCPPTSLNTFAQTSYATRSNQALLGWIFLQADELTTSSFRDKQKNSAIKRGVKQESRTRLRAEVSAGNTRKRVTVQKAHTHLPCLLWDLGACLVSVPRKLVGGASSRHQPCQAPHEVRGCGALGRRPHSLLCPFLLPYPIGAQGARGHVHRCPRACKTQASSTRRGPGGARTAPQARGPAVDPAAPCDASSAPLRSARQRPPPGSTPARAGGPDSRSPRAARPEAGRRKPRPSRPAHRRAPPGPGSGEGRRPVPAARGLAGSRDLDFEDAEGREGPAAPRFPGSGRFHQLCCRFASLYTKNQKNVFAPKGNTISLTRCLNQRSH